MMLNKLISGFDTPPPTFFDGGGVKKKLKVGQIQKSFQTECATSKFFLEAVSKKVQIKKARAPVQNARVLWLSRSSLNFFQTQMYNPRKYFQKL